MSRAIKLVLALCSTFIAGCHGGPFELDVLEDRVVFTPGGGATLDIEIERPAGHDDPVELEVFGLPADIDAEFNEEITQGDTAQLTLTPTLDAQAGELEIWVKGKSGVFHDADDFDLSLQIPRELNEFSEPHYAPGVEGVYKRVTVDGEEYTYVVIDGLAILQSDMVIAEAREMEEAFEVGDIAPRSATCNFGTQLFGFACAEWSDGQIPYHIAGDWGAQHSQMRGRIRDAMTSWEEQTGIRFVAIANGGVEITNGSGCLSALGRRIFTGFSNQKIRLGTDCTTGNIRHELGHTIGLYHEVQRDDRDQNVVVDFGRVRDGHLHNFFQMGEFERDVGAYSYGSLMHYRRWAWARNEAACMGGDLSECTIRRCDFDPMTGVCTETTGALGGLGIIQDSDRLGVYSMYPPQFTIQGATSFEVGDSFFLTLDFTTPRPTSPQQDPTEMVWTTNLSPTPLGSGHFLDLEAGTLVQGPQLITATWSILGTPIGSASVFVVLSNDNPVVSVFTNNGETEQDLANFFTVSSNVSDTEDGFCEPPICDYSWDPTPTVIPGDGTSASYRFLTEGPRTITLTVTDSAGGVGVGSVDVDIVNSPPVATIVSPAGDVVLAGGGSLDFLGTATDINQVLTCFDLFWSSSNPADVIPAPPLCNPTITFNGAGTRTISLQARDSQGALSDPDTVQVTVNSCGASCEPTALLEITSAPDVTITPDTDPTPAYWIQREMAIQIQLGDAEPDNPVDYSLIARRVGALSGDVEIASGSISVPGDGSLAAVEVLWMPDDDDDIMAWSNCAVDYRDYELVLVAQDSTSATTTTVLPIVLGCEFI